MEAVIWQRVQDVGGWSIAVAITLITLQLIRNGKLVPKSTMDTIIARYEAERSAILASYTERIAETARISEARIAEAIHREEYSRGTADIMLKVSSEQSAQITKLTEAFRPARLTGPGEAHD